MDEKKHFCRHCEGQRNYKVLQTVKRRSNPQNDYIDWIEEFQITECLGCETLSFLHVYGDSEMILRGEDGHPVNYQDYSVYPPYLENGRELKHLHLLPFSIKEIYDETIIAFKADLKILVAGGLRAIIEAICIYLEITGSNLATKIDKLSNNGHLSDKEAKRLHSIRFLGNDALHEIEKPTNEQLFHLLEIINHLLENLFISDLKIRGFLDTIIDSYPDFIEHLQTCIRAEFVGVEVSIEDILGKSIRLIQKNKFEEFKQNLLNDVQNKEIDFLQESSVPNQYKVAKMPESPLPF